MLALGMLVDIYSGNAQVYIKVRPPRPPKVNVHIHAPGPRHVWIEDEWVPHRGRYEYRGQRWVEPPRPGVVWVPGHWRHRRHGWIWVPGHWH